MTEEGQQPDKVQTPATDAEAQPKPETDKEQPENTQQITSEVFPDTLPEKADDDAKLKTLEQEKAQLDEQLKAEKTEKGELAARLKENQEYISRTRKTEQPKAEVAPPLKRNFSEYLDDRLKKFEDDPKEGFRQFMTDVAFDRDLENKDHEKRIADAETNAFKRVLKLDPEKAKVMEKIEKMEQERPDLGELTFDHKLEWARMKDAIDKQSSSSNRDNTDRERVLAGDAAGGSSGGRKADKMPAWANDPQVAVENQGRFSSKKEMIDWNNADYNKAMEMLKNK